MIVFDNNNNHMEVPHLNSLLHIGNVTHDEQIVFETSYVQCGNLFSNTEIICNYDLYVLGDIKASKLRVKRNLLILGNAEIDEIVVQGDIYCSNNLKVNNIKVGGNIQSHNLEINGTGVVKKNIVVRNSIIVQKDLTVDKEVYCFEGILGEGNCIAPKIYVKDFFDLSLKRNVVLLDELGEKNGPLANYQEQLNDEIFSDNEKLQEFSAVSEVISSKLIVLFEEYVSRIEEKLEFEEIEQRFYEIQKVLPHLNAYLDDYKQILRLANFSKIQYVDDFIILLRVKLSTPKFLYKISIVEDVLNQFFNDQKSGIENLEVKNVGRPVLIKNLYYLEKTKHLLTKQEFLFLYQRLLNELNTISLGGI